MLTIVPIRAYRLGNALSAVGSMMILARELEARLWYPAMSHHQAVFGGFDGSYGDVPTRERARIIRFMRENGLGGSDYHETVPKLEVTWSNAWWELRRVGESAAVLTAKHRHYAALELVDRAALAGLDLLFVTAPYNAQWQAARDIGWMRDVITLNPELMAAEAAKNEAIRAGNRRLIGVHLRLGDYATWREGRYFFDVPTVVRVIRTIEGWNPGKFAFRLFSNVPEEVAQHVTEGRIGRAPVVQMTGGYEEDFIGLADCDLLLGPPSTFAHWGAFLRGRPRLVLTSHPYTMRSFTPVRFETARPVSWPFTSGLLGEFWIE